MASDCVSDVGSPASVQDAKRDPDGPARGSQSRGGFSSGGRTLVRHQQWAPSLLILLLDAIIWLGLYALLTHLRNEASYAGVFQVAVVNLLQLAIIIQALFIIGGYSPRTEMRSLSYSTEHLLAMTVAFFVSVGLIYSAAAYDRSMKPSRGAVAGSFLVFTPLSLLYRRRLRQSVTTALSHRSFLVIGSGELAREFYQAYIESPDPQRLEFVDVIGSRAGQTIAGPNTPVIESDLQSKLEQASARYTGIIVAESAAKLRPELLDQLVRTQFSRTRVYTLESFYEAHWQQVPVQAIDPYWPLQSGFQLSRTSPYHYVKRLFDIGASVVGLLLLWPLMLVIAIAILFADGRPVIFRQRRVGRDERPFTIFKFRTMRVAGARPASVEGEDDGTALYTQRDDPRIFALGGWLRKLRLDELPQLWNVLQGQLSLIGPRAEWEECVRRYHSRIPLYHFRHLAKPGITGWAQVNYPYGESDEDAVEKLKYDLYYIRHYSLKLDAMIVLKTIYTMFAAKGR